MTLALLSDGGGINIGLTSVDAGLQDSRDAHALNIMSKLDEEKKLRVYEQF